MFIDNETKLRVNVNAPYKGYSKLDTPEIRAAANVVEIPEPTPPEDYSDEFYFRTEQEDAPYVVYTKKSNEAIAQIMLGKFTTAMEAHYDAVAQVKHYDTRYTCTLRAGYASAFQAEGVSFATWMDECNVYGYTEMEKVQQGVRPMPTVAELIAELPEPPWPLPVEAP
jgi:hypothetical protein